MTALGVRSNPRRAWWLLAVLASIELFGWALYLATEPASAPETIEATSAAARGSTDPTDVSSATEDTSSSIRDTTTSTAAPSPVAITEAMLRNLHLPGEACDGVVAPAVPRQLVDGSVTGPDDQGIEVSQVALGDLDGDAVADGVAVVACYSGGTLVPYGVWSVLAAVPTATRVDVGAGIDSSWELDISDPVIADRRLALTIGASEDWDAHCCPTIDAVETLELRADGYHRVGIDIVRVASVERQLEHAVNAGDTATLDRLATPQVRAQLEALRTAYGPLDEHDPYCRQDPVETAACIVGAGGWAGEIVWRREAFRAWRAVSYSDIGGGM